MDNASWKPLLPREPVAIPPDFLWGVASSAFQSEGGDVANDWVAAAQAGRVPKNPGNGFWDRYAEDFKLVAALGIRHYRLSIEWSRVEPDRGHFDVAALDHYRAICDAATAAGLTPWVNLFHFTLPQWVAQSDGFRNPVNRDAYARYVEHAAGALAGHARHFHTQNESMVYVLASYFLGENPPYVRDPLIAFEVARHVLELHARAYAILHETVADATVATIEVYLPLIPEDESAAPAAKRFDDWYHHALLHGLATGVVDLPSRDPETIPNLRGAVDMYGFNYYSASSIGASGVHSYADQPDAPIDAMGRCVCPEQMSHGLQRIAATLPGVPIIVTENGCPTIDETFRIRYVAAHLAAALHARTAGVDVRGYFHWTAVDNYEWHHGFGDARFGLIGFDPVSLAREVKRSGRWLARAIAAGRIDPADIPG
ncbi:MAG TPA: family 1 glycosylhydrolase [Candidatus Binatia bacterium]|nr:family 1 glycosylhydrolase [Candidatus Binatia bacterium]